MSSKKNLRIVAIVVTIVVFIASLSLYRYISFEVSKALNGTFYVDQATGNDNDSGDTEELAWATVQKAASTLTAGQTVLIKNGTYRETVTLTNSGTSGNPITYQNFPGHAPVISGADVITAFQAVDGIETSGLFSDGFEANKY